MNGDLVTPDMTAFDESNTDLARSIDNANFAGSLGLERDVFARWQVSICDDMTYLNRPNTFFRLTFVQRSKLVSYHC